MCMHVYMCIYMYAFMVHIYACIYVFLCINSSMSKLLCYLYINYVPKLK